MLRLLSILILAAGISRQHCLGGGTGRQAGKHRMVQHLGCRRHADRSAPSAADRRFDLQRLPRRRGEGTQGQGPWWRCWPLPRPWEIRPGRAGEMLSEELQVRRDPFQHRPARMGLHRGEYQKDIPELLKVIQQNAAGAKLIWATSTPMRDPVRIWQSSSPEQRAGQGQEQDRRRLGRQRGHPGGRSVSSCGESPGVLGRRRRPLQAQGQAVEANQVAKAILDSLGKSASH